MFPTMQFAQMISWSSVFKDQTIGIKIKKQTHTFPAFCKETPKMFKGILNILGNNGPFAGNQWRLSGIR